MNASPEEIEAAARALHRFNAPRVGNDVESWDDIGEAARARWTKMATLALGAAKAVALASSECWTGALAVPQPTDKIAKHTDKERDDMK